MPEPALKPAPQLVPPPLPSASRAPGTATPAATPAAAPFQERRDLPARRPGRGHRGEIRRGIGQGRAAHAQRNGARGLAALRLRRRRNLGQGRRADPPRHRLDHRARAALQARRRNRRLHVAAILHRRERLARHRFRDPVHRSQPVRGVRRALHDVRRAARRLVHPDGRARGRPVADDRHRSRCDRLFPGRADHLFAVARVPAVGRAQIGLPHPGAGIVAESAASSTRSRTTSTSRRTTTRRSRRGS